MPPNDELRHYETKVLGIVSHRYRICEIEQVVGFEGDDAGAVTCPACLEKLSADVEDAALKFTRAKQYVICKTCHGTGRSPRHIQPGQGGRCIKCSGIGRVWQERTST